MDRFETCPTSTNDSGCFKPFPALIPVAALSRVIICCVQQVATFNNSRKVIYLATYEFFGAISL